MQGLPAVLHQDNGLLPQGDFVVGKGGGGRAFQHGGYVIVAVGALAPDGHEHGAGLGLAAVCEEGRDRHGLVPAEELAPCGL